MNGYRKLPGRLRGVILGASVWAGPDHLLAVRSLRFREEYKRFYFRDVQAIAVARKPRFHLPVVFAAAMLLAIMRVWFAWTDLLFWPLFAVLLIVWLIVSTLFSCTCRIYTAVSRDHLPSVYRTWTARRFLAEVEPLIAQVQGVIEGEWAAAAGNKPFGPSPAGIAPEVMSVREAPIARAATPAAFAFVALLLGDALFTVLTLESDAPALFWLGWAFVLARISAAIVIFFDHHRQRLRRSMRTLAIVSLVCTGLLYYVQQVATAARTGATFAGLPDRILVMNQIDIAFNAILGIAGTLMLFRESSREINA